MNYKPFDLKKALAGEPVVTRDGRPVKIAGYNEDAVYHETLLGWADRFPFSWSKNGITKDMPDKDLFMASTKRTEWVVRCEHIEDEKRVQHTLHYVRPNIDLLKKCNQNYKITIHEITIED